MVVSIEQLVEWIANCVAYLRDKGYGTIEATRDAQDAWVDHSNRLDAETRYPLANSWYMGANVPGEPRVFLPCTGGVGSGQSHDPFMSRVEARSERSPSLCPWIPSPPAC